MKDKREHILQAAMRCFLDYGFRKTSMEDIAAQAEISRSSIYSYFHHKEEIFLALVEVTMGAALQRAQQISESTLPRDEKLHGMFRVFKLEPLKPVFEAKHGGEAFEVGSNLTGDMLEKCQCEFINLVGAVLGDRQVAEVMVLACYGLRCDAPSYAIFKKRLTALVDMGLGKHLTRHSQA